jgi:hypothetical protein
VSDLVVGEVRGYRAWRLIGSHLHALSNSDHLWESASKEAACTLAPMTGVDHPAPFTGCTCGLYAYYRPTTVPASLDQVFGVVAVAGRVILATRGMKAERMTILALVIDDAALSERYGVPIYPSREALLAVYPPQDYGELVDVDPTDPPPYATGGPVVTVGASTSAGTWKVGKRMAAMAARPVVAWIVAAPNGVTAAEARRVLHYVSLAAQVEVVAEALEKRRASHIGPTTHGLRRYARRR